MPVSEIFHESGTFTYVLQVHDPTKSQPDSLVFVRDNVHNLVPASAFGSNITERVDYFHFQGTYILVREFSHTDWYCKVLPVHGMGELHYVVLHRGLRHRYNEPICIGNNIRSLVCCTCGQKHVIDVYTLESEKSKCAMCGGVYLVSPEHFKQLDDQSQLNNLKWYTEENES